MAAKYNEIRKASNLTLHLQPWIISDSFSIQNNILGSPLLAVHSLAILLAGLLLLVACFSAEDLEGVSNTSLDPGEEPVKYTKEQYIISDTTAVASRKHT